MYLLRFFEPLFLSGDAAEHVRFGWWLLGFPVLAAILLGNAFLFLLIREDRKQRAVRTLVLCMIVFAGADLAYYLQAAYRRATVSEKACKVTTPSPHGPYDAVVCLTPGIGGMDQEAGFVRLRSTKDGSILAEQDFYSPSPDQVGWTPHSLSVGVGEASASFKLPPSSWDRLLARLP
jgi:hypothetical protein